MSQHHQWSYRQPDSESSNGPISESEFVERLRDGSIKRDSLVMSPTRTKGKWGPVTKIPSAAKLINSDQAESLADSASVAESGPGEQTDPAETVKVPRFSKLLMLCVVGGLLVCGLILILFMSGGSDDSNGGAGAAQGTTPDPTINLTPMAREYFNRHKDSPTAVPDLIAEMLEKEEPDSTFFQEQLSLHGCDSGEMLRQISSKLQETTDSKQFERIVRVLDNLSPETRKLPEMKTHIPSALAAAGQHVEVAQLREMDGRVLESILDTAQLPDNAELLEKLASINDQWNRKILFKLPEFDSEDAAQLALKIVQQTNGDPETLPHFINSEAVCHYLWNGKLTGEKAFQNLRIGGGEASLKAFSQIVGPMIDNDPESVVGPVMSMYQTGSSDVTRDSLPEESIQKMDDTISSKVDEYLSFSLEEARLSEQRSEPGPFAFLYLAELFGGKKTAIEIARMAAVNPAVLENYEAIGDVLLSINEPESYDAIAEIWARHVYNDQKQLRALRDEIGPAIEPNFLEKLKNELGKEKKDTNRLTRVVRALKEVGTTNSIATLIEIETGRLKSKARNAVDEIQKREKTD